MCWYSSVSDSKFRENSERENWFVEQQIKSKRQKTHITLNMCHSLYKWEKTTLSLYSKTAICQQIGFNNWDKIYRLVYSAHNIVIVNIKACVWLSNSSPAIKCLSHITTVIIVIDELWMEHCHHSQSHQNGPYDDISEWVWRRWSDYRQQNTTTGCRQAYYKLLDKFKNY